MVTERKNKEAGIVSWGVNQAVTNPVGTAMTAMIAPSVVRGTRDAVHNNMAQVRGAEQQGGVQGGLGVMSKQVHASVDFDNLETANQSYVVDAIEFAKLSNAMTRALKKKLISSGDVADVVTKITGDKVQGDIAFIGASAQRRGQRPHLSESSYKNLIDNVANSKRSRSINDVQLKRLQYNNDHRKAHPEEVEAFVREFKKVKRADVVGTLDMPLSGPLGKKAETPAAGTIKKTSGALERALKNKLISPDEAAKAMVNSGKRLKSTHPLYKGLKLTAEESEAGLSDGMRSTLTAHTANPDRQAATKRMRKMLRGNPLSVLKKKQTFDDTINSRAQNYTNFFKVDNKPYNLGKHIGGHDIHKFDGRELKVHKGGMSKKSSYALPSIERYPLNDYGQVKQAAAYFETYGRRMPPEDRREFCWNLVKRAEELAIPVSEDVLKYGSDKYASAQELEVSIFSRMNILTDPEHVALLQKVASDALDLEPEVFCELLGDFDKVACITHLYDRDIMDPYYSTYGDKTASDDADYSDTIGNLYVTGRDLMHFGKVCHKSLKHAFGEDMADEFQKDPVGIYKSMPVEQKKIIIRLATENAPGVEAQR